MLVLSSGLENYRQVSQEWAPELAEIKAEIDHLIDVNTKIIPACSAKEMLVLPSSVFISAKSLGNRLRACSYNPQAIEYKVAKAVSVI